MKTNLHPGKTEINVFSGNEKTASVYSDQVSHSEVYKNIKNFSDLKPGDKFKAVVTDITPNQVTIKLASGNSLTAKSLILPEARIGEESIFAVKENFKGQILLEMIKPDNNALQVSIVKEALRNAALAVTKENVDLVTNLVNNNLPINQETLHKAAFFNYSKGDITLDKLLFLLKEGFEASEISVTMLNRLMDKSLGLDKSLKDIITGIIEIESPQIKSNLIEILLNQEKHSSALASDSGEKIPAGSTSTINTVFQAGQQMESNIQLLLKRLMSTSADERSAAEKALVNEIDKQLFINLNDIKNADIEKTNIEKTDMEKTDRSSIGQYFKELAQVINRISNRLEAELKSQAYTASEDTSYLADKNPDTRLAGQIIKLNSTVSDAADNLRFMNQIQNYKEYMQVPFSVNGEKNQGELYIFKKAKQGSNINKQASILIAVDFALLGRVECFINKASKNLNFDFRLEDNNVLNLVKKNSSILFDTLSAKGYKVMGVTFKRIETEHKLTDDMASQEKTSSERRYAFDMRV